jgi:hypothetical protein
VYLFGFITKKWAFAVLIENTVRKVTTMATIMVLSKNKVLGKKWYTLRYITLNCILNHTGITFTEKLLCHSLMVVLIGIKCLVEKNLIIN